MKILYLGQESGTSQLRAGALGRLGHEALLVDPYRFLPSGRAVRKWIFETGARFLERPLRARLLGLLWRRQFDVVWVDGGELFGPRLVRELRARYGPVVNYNHDNPFADRDHRKWRLYRKSLPEYSLVAVVRDENEADARRLGAVNVLRVTMCADEVAHAPRAITGGDRQQWSSEVAFIGTWMPERGPFLADLIRRGVPLTIIGDRWERAREWPLLRTHWRCAGLKNPDDYAKAVQCAKICLGLLSKGNHDLHTTRSFEIPYLGSLLCAERTSEHMALYRDGEEAVFFSTPAECANLCEGLLHDEERRAVIARTGQARCMANGTMNEPVAAGILQRLANDGVSSSTAADVQATKSGRLLAVAR